MLDCVVYVDGQMIWLVGLVVDNGMLGMVVLVVIVGDFWSISISGDVNCLGIIVLVVFIKVGKKEIDVFLVEMEKVMDDGLCFFQYCVVFEQWYQDQCMLVW